jgi:hypothetical protein
MTNTKRNWKNWAAEKWLTSYRLNALRTAAYGFTHRRRATRLSLVLGCQRSGTTMLSSVLGLSPLVKDFGEGDSRYFSWQGAPRLLPLDVVRQRLSQERNPFTLFKPLCESQRAAEIMQAFPTARGVWIFRRYQDCVRSHVRYYRQFHDGLAYVDEMLRTDSPCWKNEGLSSEILDFLASFSGRTLNLETAYALFWLARNSLFERLPTEAPVKIVSYEAILKDPAGLLESIFDYLSIPFRSKYACLVTTPTFKHNETQPTVIDAEVAKRCDELFDRLNQCANSADARRDVNSTKTPTSPKQTV